jgi:hypothetical protein
VAEAIDNMKKADSFLLPVDKGPITHWAFCQKKDAGKSTGLQMLFKTSLQTMG